MVEPTARTRTAVEHVLAQQVSTHGITAVILYTSGVSSLPSTKTIPKPL